MFFIFGLNRKPVGKETRNVRKNGFDVKAIITVYKLYIELFFIPLIPLGKRYSIYIPHSDEYYEQGFRSKIPDEYLEICKDVGRLY
ncbi:hypothetical protein H1R16_05270 [Marnyiella aurantia]|uniref:Uncharacterized protein n=1 Tax=Marnyiella aurantia TaxID=2758037 RepID=A0A7D7LTE5_9FLAO|nr:hypothetical protein [Marnyiella aurantia]MBA5247669.1 hypothetical protein [Marnyiella aurantia]QMS99418.1 hypothetical protein H1R16_05270 [Marnyiella aurantia]